MTTLTHCDGPGCDASRPDRNGYTFGGTPWHELEAGKDFCTTECLHRWSAPPITSEQGTPFYEHIANDAKIDLDKLEAMADVAGPIPPMTDEQQIRFYVRMADNALRAMPDGSFPTLRPEARQ